MDKQERATAVESRLRQLFVQGLGGDSAAYHMFLKELTALLRAFLRKRLSSMPEDVEDLVQETLLAVHTYRHTYRQGLPLTAWVHTIARYKMIDLLRSRARREALNDPLDDELEIFGSSDIDATEAKRDLSKLLQALPDRHRLPIVLMKLHGLSVVEAARATGMSESAVKIGVNRGLKALSAKFRGGA